MRAGLAVTRALGGPSLRSLPPWPLVGAVTAAVALGAVATQAAPVPTVRLAAVALAAGAALAVPDPSAPTTEAVPVRRALRAAMRLVPLAAGWAAAWLAVVGWARPPALAALTLEALVLLLAATSVALVADRRGRSPLGGAAAPLVVLGAGLLGPGALRVFDPAGPAVGPGLIAVGAVALACAAAATVRDPGGRRPYHRR